MATIGSEVGSGVGGNWRYMNDNGMSSAYRSLHINTSRRMMEYATFPMPDDYPDYPDHFQIARYFDEYVDHFGFRDRIRFQTEVMSVEPDEPSPCLPTATSVWYELLPARSGRLVLDLAGSTPTRLRATRKTGSRNAQPKAMMNFTTGQTR